MRARKVVIDHDDSTARGFDIPKATCTTLELTDNRLSSSLRALISCGVYS